MQLFPLRVLHRGRTNTLTLVRDRLTGHQFVLKQTVVEIPFHNALMKHEIVVHQTLKHRHIIAFVQEQDDNAFLMEFAHFGSLRMIMNQPQWSVDLGINVLKQIVKALVHLHNQGLAHNDLKPENILLTEDYRAKLGDFALCSPHDRPFPIPLPDFFFLGSSAYAMRNRRLKSQSSQENDLFALGVMIKEICLGFSDSDQQRTARLVGLANRCTSGDIRQIDHIAQALNEIESGS